MSDPSPVADKKVKLKGLRKIISDTMRHSIVELPQGTLWNKVEMDGFLKLKDELKARDPRISVTALLVKAVSHALSEYPELNSAIIDNELVTYKSHNIGVAADSRDGLYVLVIKEVQDRSIGDIAEKLKSLVTSLQDRSLDPADLQGGTFTLSNLGMYDLDGFTPLLFPPQTAILGVGGTKKEAVVRDDDSLAVARRAELALTVNHAAVDGAPAARFLERLSAILQQPRDYLAG